MWQCLSVVCALRALPHARVPDLFLGGFHEFVEFLGILLCCCLGEDVLN